MMGITKLKFGNEHKMSTNSFSHYLLFLGLFVEFTYNKKHPPEFGAVLAFWCILIPFLGLSFCYILNNLSNYNVLTASAPFFYQISGTWSNHEGSILSWCWIPSLMDSFFVTPVSICRMDWIHAGRVMDQHESGTQSDDPCSITKMNVKFSVIVSPHKTHDFA
ncbi:unnamed protein product [Musa acuminata subsp. burmannicoides]